MINDKIKFIIIFSAIFIAPVFAFGATTSITLAPSQSATLSLSPSSGFYNVGDIFSVAVSLDTKGNAAQGVDIFYLNYNPALLEVQDDDVATAGVQIGKGSLMPNTLLNAVDATTGKILFSQVTNNGVSYTGVGTLATIRFKALSVGAAQATFDFALGNTTDTNVASDGTDILTSVTNGSYTITSSTSSPDVTPPIRSGGSPTGTLVAGTTQTTLSLATNENATCKYGAAANIAYGSLLNAFSTTGGTAHSAALSGLSDGATYSYYVRCVDVAGNANTDDYVVAFSIATTPPANTGTSGGGGGGGGGYTPPTTTTNTPMTNAQSTATTTTQTPAPIQTNVNQPPVSSLAFSPYLPVGIGEGSLVRGPDGIKVYIVNYYGYMRHIFNPAIFNMYGHFKWDQIKTLDQQTMDSLKSSDFYRADGDARVFSLKEINEAKGLAQKRWMNISGDKFTQLGYKWEQVFIINSKERDYYQEGTPLTEQELTQKAPTITMVATLPSGSLAKTPDYPTVYYITTSNLKKPIPSATVFNSYSTNKWENIKTVSQETLDKYPTVKAIKLSIDAKVYLLDFPNWQKHWVKTSSAFSRLNLKWEEVASVNQTEFNAYQEGSAIE